MRTPNPGQILVETDRQNDFPVALVGRKARPAAAPANDNKRPPRYLLNKSLGLILKALPPIIGALVIIYAMTQ